MYPAEQKMSIEENVMVDHLKKSLNELKENNRILDANKENFKEGIKRYEELIQK
jgi:hypothetical protein